MKQWIQKIAVYALAAATACFCVACASAQPSGSASESIQQTTSQELTYDKQNHTPMHQSGYTFQIIDVTSGEESATIFFTMSPLDSKQAAENLTITTSTGDCTASVLKYDEQNKQALFECSVDMNASEKMKILVQGDGVYATVPVTVLADKSVQTDTPLTSATGKRAPSMKFASTPAPSRSSTRCRAIWKHKANGTSIGRSTCTAHRTSR